MNYTWSYSSLKEYINCPRQYHEVKVLRRFQKRVTEEMRYGTVVHKACEDYVGEGTPLPENYKHFQPSLDELLKIPGERFPERKMALNRDREVCGYSEKGYWVRGIVDLLIVDGNRAFIVDYKTGSNKYPDPNQLKLMALMTFAHFPEVNSIKAALMFIVKNSFVTEDYTREDIQKLWGTFNPELMRLDMSYETNVWNPNSTPLCGWCPVNTCEYNRGR